MLELGEVWCGEFILILISQMQQVKIQVYNSDGEKKTFNVTNANQTLNLYVQPVQILHHLRYSYIHTINPRPIINLSSLDLSRVAHEESFPHILTTVLPNLKLGCLNVRGIGRFEKRETLDQHFFQTNLQIVALQEVKISCSTIWTTNYVWKINHYNRPQTGRGTAILINPTFNDHLVRFVSVTENLCFLELKFSHISVKSFIVINFYSYSEGDPLAPLEFSNLQHLIKKFLNKSEIIILGDFNAHIGAEDVSENDPLIGTHLYHLHTNNNEESLISLIRFLKLEVVTTRRHKTLATWTNGTQTSQIDHILKPTTSKYYVHLITGHFVPSLTDHKLLIIMLKLNPSSRYLLPVNQHRNMHKYRDWDTKLLKQEQNRERYNAKTSEGIQHLKNDGINTLN